MIHLSCCEIACLLGELGVEKGDTVIVHSSLSSMGMVDGGPDAVIDALLNAVGEEGTLVMPAFSDNMKDAFDPENTKSDVGIISEVFRKRKDVLRSYHPTHSVCASGKNAEHITQGHQFSKTPCGRETPFYKIKELDGKIILLGVDMNRNTMLHAIEEEAYARYLIDEIRLPLPTYFKNTGSHSDNNSDQTIVIRSFPAGHRDFLKLTPLLRENRLIKERYIGSAYASVMECGALFAFVLDLLKKEPDFFLCSNIFCNSCVASRQKIKDSYFKWNEIENKCRNIGCEVCLT